MRCSEETDEIASALSRAQAQFPTIPKSHEAVIPTKTGGSYRYVYADLSDVVEAVRDILGQHELAVAQMPEMAEDGTPVLTTRVMHKSGQWMEGTMRLSVADLSPQSLGSAITYARRYAFCSALGVISDQDDDGALAQRAYGDNAPRRRRPPSSSTPTAGPSAPRRTSKPDGPPMMTPTDRNKLLAHLAHLSEPVVGAAVLAKVNETLRTELKAISDLTAADGAALFAALGIDP